MKEVTVDRRALLSVLCENKAKHICAYKAAHKEWLHECRERVELMALKLQGDNYSPPYAPFASEPISYESEYTRALTMVEMSVDETITLSQQEFNQWVMDEWSWKGQFNASTLKYAGKA